MTLNRRLLLGISPLLVIFLAVGIYGIYLFTKLGGAIDVSLRENYASVVASQNMKEASERMDSGLLFALGGEEARGRDLFQQYIPVFEKNSDAEAKNITLPGEGDLEAEVTPEDQRLALEQRPAGRRLPADADRGFGLEPHCRHRMTPRGADAKKRPT